MFENITTTQESKPVMLNYTAMYDFKTIKAELQRRRNKVRHFTKAFLQIFAQAQQDRQSNIINGIDDSYLIKGEYDAPEEPPRILVTHSWDKVRETAFYRVESGSYCEFLQIAYDIEQKAREKAEREQNQEVKAA